MKWIAIGVFTGLLAVGCSGEQITNAMPIPRPIGIVEFRPNTSWNFTLTETAPDGTLTRSGTLDLQLFDSVVEGSAATDSEAASAALLTLEVGDRAYSKRINLRRGGVFEQLVAGALLDGFDPEWLMLASTPFLVLSPSFAGGPLGIVSGSQYVGPDLITIRDQWLENSRHVLMQRNGRTIVEMWLRSSDPLPVRTVWHGGDGITREALLIERGVDAHE